MCQACDVRMGGEELAAETVGWTTLGLPSGVGLGLPSGLLSGLGVAAGETTLSGMASVAVYDLICDAKRAHDRALDADRREAWAEREAAVETRGWLTGRAEAIAARWPGAACELGQAAEWVR